MRRAPGGGALHGGVAYRFTSETLNSLFLRADKKLYKAKKTGRNRIGS